MQRVTLTTHLQHRTPRGGLTRPGGHETLTIDRPHPFAQWRLLGSVFTLYPIHPGQTYSVGRETVRTIACSQIH